MSGGDDPAQEAEARRLERKALRHDQRRAELVEAARRVLVASGPSGFSVADVAREAGTSKARVYYYFPSKDALIWHLLESLLEVENHAMLAAIEAAPDGVSAIGEVMRARARVCIEDPEGFQIVWVWAPGMVKIGPEQLQALYAWSRVMIDRLEARLIQDRDAGRLHAETNPRELANVVYLASQGILMMYSHIAALGGGMATPLPAMIEQAAGHLMRGARP